ncbi:Endo-1,4-beta-xylanase A precursor [compost metagenome]
MFEKQADGTTKVTIKRNGNSIYTVLSSAKTFDDVSKHWAKADIELLASKLVVKGATDSSFAPDNNITRAEFAALLVRSLGLATDAAGITFTDVKSGDWYAGAIGAAVKAKLVDGFEDNSFQPNDTITREQMAVMIAKAITAVGQTIDISGKQDGLLAKFQDKASISSWAQTAVAQAVQAKIIAGMTDETFVPSANASRAQAVVMLKRLMQYVDFIN